MISNAYNDNESFFEKKVDLMFYKIKLIINKPSHAYCKFYIFWPVIRHMSSITFCVVNKLDSQSYFLRRKSRGCHFLRF